MQGKPHVERPGGVASYAGEPIPNPNSKAKANEWLDRAGRSLHQYGVLAAGPKWSVLRISIIFYEKVENDELVITDSTGADPPFPTSFRSTGGSWWSSIQGRTVQSANQGEAPPKSGSNTIISGESKTVPNHPTIRSAPCSSRSNTAKPLSLRAVNSALPVLPSVAFLEPVQRNPDHGARHHRRKFQSKTRFKLTTPKIGTYSK